MRFSNSPELCDKGKKKAFSTAIAECNKESIEITSFLLFEYVIVLCKV